jgi:type I restriction enzyme S subunit
VTRLADVAEIESGSGFPTADQGDSDAEFPFLKVSDMNLPGNEIEITRWNNTVSEGVRARLRARAFPANTVIFPKIGAAIATNKKRLLTRPSCIDNNCMGVTGDPSRIEPRYLYYLFRKKDLSDFASDSNPPSIRKTEVEAWDIRVPSLSEQQRLVDLLSRAENIVRMRREAEAKAKEIIPALFVDMFGDPERNPKGWNVKPLGELVDFISGGTPSKSRSDYWEGGLPWVSPKDMKVPEILNAEDHVSDQVPVETSIKLIPAGAVLIVVRGMILVHTAPVAITRVPATINQDMKALISNGQLASEFLMWLLRISQSWLLSLVTTAAHGTRKIDTSRLEALQIIVPPRDEQELFVDRARALRNITSSQKHAVERSEQAFQSLLAGVFDGT